MSDHHDGGKLSELEDQLAGVISTTQLPSDLKNRIRTSVRVSLRKKTLMDDCKLICFAFGFLLFSAAICWGLLSYQLEATKHLIGKVPVEHTVLHGDDQFKGHL